MFSSRGLGGVVAATMGLVAVSSTAAPVLVKAPLVCSRGADNAFNATVTMPFSEPTGATFTVRIDGSPSGTISHAGLNYLHDMATDFLLPVGTRYVEGSAHIVAGTGTENVRVGARVWHDAGKIRVLLPAHVENGGGYTRPSIEFDLTITAPPRSVLSLMLDHYEVKANAVIVGDVVASCDPKPKPYTIGVTMVDPASP